MSQKAGVWGLQLRPCLALRTNPRRRGAAQISKHKPQVCRQLLESSDVGELEVCGAVLVPGVLLCTGLIRALVAPPTPQGGAGALLVLVWRYPFF